jgi:hypothetical protein
MPDAPNSADLCLRMTAEDLQLIMSALDAYSHNKDYVDLLDRLAQQLPAPRLGQRMRPRNSLEASNF